MTEEEAEAFVDHLKTFPSRANIKEFNDKIHEALAKQAQEKVAESACREASSVETSAAKAANATEAAAEASRNAGRASEAAGEGAANGLKGVKGPMVGPGTTFVFDVVNDISGVMSTWLKALTAGPSDYVGPSMGSTGSESHEMP